MKELSDKRNGKFIEWLNFQWNIEFDSVRLDVDIQGSPERALSRVVFQTKSGTLYLLEKFFAGKFNTRQRVADTIEYLNQNSLRQALLSLKSKKGEFLPFYKEDCFQITPFLDGTQLNRPDYLSSSKMGESFGLFLVHLSKASENINYKISFTAFSIKDYIYKLFSQMKIHDNEIYKKFIPYLVFLEKEFMPVHDQLPQSFCHGDLHPLNVIWDHDKIKAVIDWEFTGIKPDIYDVANLIGCAGIEDPNSLGMPMVMTCLKTIQKSRLYSELGWQFFPEYVLALRFAWLSEWLRKKDEPMIEMEEAYMRILVDNMDILRKGWGIRKNKK
ncbi:MAG: aminoglycoside phosphotransferase family protein [Desulfobacteraceae bacterium]|nr:aminoglycoside phosphotransferase family protein [Desulfobacteraceae bacterium]